MLPLLTDSYKLSHFNQYPEGTTKVYCYMEARKKGVVFFGLRYYLIKYLQESMLKLDIEGCERLANEHGLPFNKEGWEYIKQLGHLPVEIKAIKEGTYGAVGEVLLTVMNTDPKCYWLPSYLETLLLKVWYPSSVASFSQEVKELITSYHTETCDNISGVTFSFHNFGDRGSTSVEAAALGGVAHLTQFMGTDNFNCLMLSNEYYDGKYKGYSIPATEHSTVTAWGKDNEHQMINNYLETYKDSPIIACVLDSYDIYASVNYATSGEVLKKVESEAYPIFVIRPDSGNPVVVIGNILDIIEKNSVAYSMNSKGYKVLSKYRIIWGDGINADSIKDILDYTSGRKYAASNVSFGCGGTLMQGVTRDTYGFAYKTSAIEVNGKLRDVYKDPITDKGKTSKKGIQQSVRLSTVFKDGVVYA